MEEGGQAHWIPLSDLMTGMMMIFMVVAAAFMLRVEQTTTMVVKDYAETKRDLQRALQKEFKDNLKQWNAEMLGDMTLRFDDPATQFQTGSAELRPQFRTNLAQFFPRYAKLLSGPRYRDAVKEVRIEGHTSTFWNRGVDERTAYFRNMALSQERTRSALEFVIGLERDPARAKWLRAHMTANGLSSSHPILRKDGSVDELASQRVEFRIVTNAEDRMDRLARGLAKP